MEEKPSNISDVSTYFFKPTERIKGFLYIKDGYGNFVGLEGKKLKYKTITRCADMVYNLEFARNEKLKRSV